MAQQTISTTGGEAAGSEGTASYSVGQIAFTTYFETNGSASQGVQQPYEISVALGTGDAKGIQVLFSVLPNPTSDFVILHIEDYDFSLLSFLLCDETGKILVSGKISEPDTKIEVGNLPPTLYFLKIFNNKQTIKSFKIVKY
jgi:hypothetical protein